MNFINRKYCVSIYAKRGDIMKKEDLIALKEKISNLNEEEKKQRDLYLRGISSGDIQGPMTGYASVDKPWLKYYKKS